MSTEEKLVVAGIVILGGYIFLKNSSATAARVAAATATTPAAAPPPAGTNQNMNEIYSLFGFLLGPGNNGGSTNSTNGVSANGAVNTLAPAVAAGLSDVGSVFGGGSDAGDNGDYSSYGN